MIEVRDLSKTYPGSVVALEQVTLSFAPGEIFGILGRSGAGKSTLLRHLNLLETPSSGEVYLDGVNLKNAGPSQLRKLRRSMGMVFQHFNLLASRTVIGNIEFPLEVAGVPQQQRRQRAERLLELVGLTEKREVYPAHLSGGQKQRVGIARALAAEPKVLLCDEATSALDTETTAQILDLLAKINTDLGITVIMVTHELEVVRRICHAAALLESGRVVESGRVADLLAQPDSILAERILPTGLNGRALAYGEALVTLTGANAETAIISGLTKDLHLDVSLLGGGVERIGGSPVSRLLLQLRPEEGDLDPVKTLSYLQGRGVQAVLG